MSSLHCYSRDCSLLYSQDAEALESWIRVAASRSLLFGGVGDDGEWKVNESTYNGEELSLGGYCRLRKVVIGDDCFDAIRRLEVVGLKELESMVIGNGSFTTCKGEHESHDGMLRVSDCPRLQFISTGDYAFGDYSSFQLESLPSLRSLQLGEGCFYNAPLFSLRSVYFRRVTSRSPAAAVSHAWQSGLLFLSVHCVGGYLKGGNERIDMEQLACVELGENALRGDGGDSRKTINEEPFNYKNTLIIRSFVCARD